MHKGGGQDVFWDAHTNILMVGFSTWIHTAALLSTKKSLVHVLALLLYNFQQILAERGRDFYPEVSAEQSTDMHK